MGRAAKKNKEINSDIINERNSGLVELADSDCMQDHGFLK